MQETVKQKWTQQARPPTAWPQHEKATAQNPARSRAVLPSARNNCPAGCKPQLAGAYCPPLRAGFQQIHMLSRLNPYLLPSRRTEKQQISYYSRLLSSALRARIKQFGFTNCEAQTNVHTTACILHKQD